MGSEERRKPDSALRGAQRARWARFRLGQRRKKPKHPRICFARQDHPLVGGRKGEHLHVHARPLRSHGALPGPYSVGFLPVRLLAPRIQSQFGSSGEGSRRRNTVSRAHWIADPQISQSACSQSEIRAMAQAATRAARAVPRLPDPRMSALARVRCALPHTQDTVNAVAPFGDSHIISGGSDSTLRLWSLKDGRLARTSSRILCPGAPQISLFFVFIPLNVSFNVTLAVVRRRSKATRALCSRCPRSRGRSCSLAPQTAQRASGGRPSYFLLAELYH